MASKSGHGAYNIISGGLSLGNFLIYELKNPCLVGQFFPHFILFCIFKGSRVPQIQRQVCKDLVECNTTDQRCWKDCITVELYVSIWSIGENWTKVSQ